MTRLTGRVLNKQWEVGARHALYRQDGEWYHVLKRFPGALFDANGYVVFETEVEYRRCPGMSIGSEKNWTHVPAGISNLPGYVRMK